MIHGILWDNDGVLVDTEHLYYETNRDYLRTHGIELSERNFVDWFLRKNTGVWHLLRARGLTEAEIDACRQTRNALYTEKLLKTSGLEVPGVRNVLENLHGRVPMGVVTSANREHYDAIHEKLGLNEFFDFVLTAEAYKNSKPDPEPYLLGLHRLGLPAEHCVVVEDSPRGLESALAAGMRCIILRNALTKNQSFSGAYKVVDTMNCLLGEITEEMFSA